MSRMLFDDVFSSFSKSLRQEDEAISTPFERFRWDPIGFAEQVLGVTLWEGQREMMQSVVDNRNTSVSACPSTGKTFGAACIALWLHNCFPMSKVIVTAAPPERQIKDLLFGAIRFLQKRGLRRGVPLSGGEPKTMAIDADVDEWWIHGFTIPTSGSREERISKFHGHHGRGGTFAILDEAHGIPGEIAEAIDNCLTGELARQLYLFNPLAPVGLAYSSTRDPEFNVITLSAFDHPNVIEGRDVFPGMVDRATTQNRINKFTRPLEPGDSDVEDLLVFQVPWTGESRVVENPVFCYKVLGVFPWEGDRALVPLAHISRMQRNYIILLEEARKAGYKYPIDLIPPMCGVDMAEYGQDSVCLATRHSNLLRPLERWNRTPDLVTVDRIARRARAVDAMQVNIDATGFTTIAPLLREKEINAVGVKVAWSPTREVEDGQFVSMRDQLAWSVREWAGRLDSAMPSDEDLEADMLAFDYFITRRGIRVTKKDDVRRSLLGRSPDGFDALMMTFYKGTQSGRGPGDGVKVMTIRRPSRGVHRGRFLGRRRRGP